MKEPTPYERNSYGALGSLCIRDVRYDPNNIAYCNPLPDGRVQFRIQTELAMASGRLIINDGEPHTLELTHLHDCSRWRYWQAVFKPAAPKTGYSFHFLLETGQPYYFGSRGVTHVVESRFELDLDEQKPVLTPDWAKHAPIYQIFPDRYLIGDPDLPRNKGRGHDWGSVPESTMFMGGDLNGITQKIDHIKNLGIKTIYLNPIFQSPSNHKYDATDFYAVDEAFGGDSALRNLVTAAHDRDMKVVLDASFNHAHPSFFAFQDVIKNGRQSDYWDWFTIYDWPITIEYRPHTLSAEQASNPGYQKYINYLLEIEQQAGIPFIEKEDEGDLFEPNFMAWYNVINMPKLNQNNPACHQYFLDVAVYWLTEFDIDGWRMDVAQFVPDDFWHDFYRVCKATKPDCYLLAEIWGDTSHWLQGDMFDGTMNYLFRDIALEYFAKQKMSTADLKDSLLRLDATYAPQIAAINQNLLSSHDVNRFLNMADEDKTKFALATIFQMSLAGAPGVYYGDEVGMSGGHDPDNRRAFDWDESTWDMQQFNLTKELLLLREHYPQLKHGQLEWLAATDDAFAMARSDEDGRVVIIINRSDHMQT
ncbi:MAG: cyclomaltodextrinase, partial [Cellvibrionaceae bacterium]